MPERPVERVLGPAAHPARASHIGVPQDAGVQRDAVRDASRVHG